jgi:hypothetical protein
LYRFLAIAVLLDVKDIPQVGPLQWGRIKLRRIVGFSPADEIEKLDRLKKAGSITDAEFSRLRAKLVQ